MSATTANTAAAGSAAPDELKQALQSPMRRYWQALRLSLVVGVLMLAPTWFMFEVYGRVLNSRSESTLAWLLIAAIPIYVVLELIELVRHRTLQAAAQHVHERLKRRVFDASFAANLKRAPGGNVQAVNDLKTVTDFIPSPAVTGVLDLPAALGCLVLLFLMSPWLGVLAMITAGLHASISAYQERNSSRPYGEANRAAGEAQLRAAGTLRNAQVIESMGMAQAMHKRWTESQSRFMLRLGQASDSAGAGSAASKMLMQLQGSLLLGLAVWLSLSNSLVGGAAMAIVASILGGRVLAPLAQLVGQWRAVGNLRSAYGRVQALLKSIPEKAPGMVLPAPKGVLIAEGLVVCPPGTQTPALNNVSFGALPGEMLTVIGPSAAGKSTLARTVIGVWPAQAGKVRLDGADMHNWHKTQLGPHIGYLPQGVELFDGTVAENIARFGTVDKALVRQAAEEVGITEMIEALPQGFDTQIGDEGAVLSGGQRQRLGLARAVYGQPRLVVLDEPNSSLDDAGEKALLALIGVLKKRGTTVISITHRTSMLGAADKLLLLNEGAVANFGPRDTVLTALRTAHEKAEAQAKGAPVAAKPAAEASVAAPKPAPARAPSVQPGTAVRPGSANPLAGNPLAGAGTAAAIGLRKKA